MKRLRLKFFQNYQILVEKFGEFCLKLCILYRWRSHNITPSKIEITHQKPHLLNLCYIVEILWEM